MLLPIQIKISQKSKSSVASRGRLLASAGLASLGLAACAPQVSQQAAGDFTSSVTAGNYSIAARIATDLANSQRGGPELLWSMNAGAAHYYAGNPNDAIRNLDAADGLIRQAGDNSFSWGSTYRFRHYDAVMVNVYGALANLSAGNADNARVELRRMEERHALTLERHRRDIAESNAARERQIAEYPSLRQSISMAQQSADVRASLQNLDRYRGYEPYVNPAGLYVRGIYLMNSDVPSDAEEARQALSRVVAVSRRPAVVVQDAAMAAQVASGRSRTPAVWVVFENGQSPTFRQLNFTVPMPVLAQGGRGVSVRPVTVSMPDMVYQPSAFPRLEIAAGSARANTEVVASIEAVMAADFRRRYPDLLAGAVVEAVLKAAGISVANAAGSRVGGIGAVAIDIAATAAANITVSDTRSWQLLPREFQAARVPVPADGRVTIRPPGGQAQTVTVPTDRSSLIMVKAQTSASPLTIQVNRL